MAINTLAICDRPVPHNTPRHKGNHVLPGRLHKLDLDQFAQKRVRPRKKKNSAYNCDKLHLLSRITEKRFVHRKNELFSSFPLAANIYKASSDEFKIIKKKQKVKKSVLTLPNVPAPLPQSCTVSDMNDSEYYEQNKTATKKKLPSQNRKARVRTKSFEVYDRDAKHIHLDSSSTELIQKPYNGDCKTVMGRAGLRSDKDDRSITAQDVWTVLRNINRFQFTTPARLSDENIVKPNRKKAFNRRCNIRTGRRLIETRRTEEISYVANFKIKSNASVSPSTSNDRVTVINKNEVPKLADKPLIKNLNLPKVANKPKNGIVPNDKNLNRPKNNARPMQRYQPMCRNRLENTNKPVHAVHEPIPESTCTVRESIDSSNYFRSDSDNLSSSNNVTKKFTHPSRIEQIILTNTGGANNAVKNAVRYAEDSSPERGLKGITQMVFNQETNGFLNKGDAQKRKPRLVTTMPSAAAMPKMTAADIKRRIAQMKFPLTILGRDELSSSIEVPEQHPQFNGLDEHIWPFMTEWGKKGNEQRDGMYVHSAQQAKRSVPVERYTSNLKKANNEVALIKNKDKKVTYCDTSPRKKVDHKRIDENVTTPRKSRPIRLKDKMLKLLYKKPSMHDMEQCTETGNKMDVDMDVTTAVSLSQNSSVLPKRPENILVTFSKGMNNEIESGQKMIESRHPWARAKWASDFIDNVMRKIKSGAYYNYEGKRNFIENVNNAVIKKVANKLDAGTCVDFYDVAVQTLSTLNNSIKKEPEERVCLADFQRLVANGFDPLTSIPGFDDTLPEFEIKTLNVNQIAVKHCLTNVMVQFDVAGPDKSNNLTVEVKKSSSSTCVPVTTTESLTKIFKCNTTILNAVLPAELCSVIPKVMRSIMDSSDSSLTIQTSFTDSHVTISEISECDSIGPLLSICPGNESDVQVQDITPGLEIANDQWPYYPPNKYMCAPNNYCIAPVNKKNRPFGKTNQPSTLAAICSSPQLPLHKSPLLKVIMNGRFPLIGVIRRKSLTIPKEKLIEKMKHMLLEYNILPKLCTKALMCCVVDPIQLRILQCKEIMPINESPKQLMTETPTCSSLVSYKGFESLRARLGDFTSLLQNMWNYCKFNIHFSMPYYTYVRPLQLIYDNNNVTVNMVIGDNNGTEKNMTVTVSKVEIDSIYSRFAKQNCLENGTKTCTSDALPVKSSDSVHNSRSNKLSKKSQEKIRKAGYVKLYKKCKSTTNISGERSCTPLNKIVNLDDFFQALGSAKTLSSVLDGCPGQKILSCLGEMKSWIKDITPRQALLVLILTNKKDTPNLVRFRPVLLQGIAVNRITRATELDMEIEVIEKENVKLSQYEGISYIPASEANQDTLLEELCWIAKTTASDYQRPFDETSEKLLKSLLEKRKKLNPSYLRVMARYVGLGLLKTPKSKN